MMLEIIKSKPVKILHHYSWNN